MNAQSTPLLGAIIDRNERLFPEKTAIVCDGRRLTHREFAGRVRRLSEALHRRGLRHGKRVSLLAMNCTAMLEVYGAAEWAGFLVNPVNWRLAAPEVAHILEDAAPLVLVFEAQYQALVDALRPRLSGIRHFIRIAGEAGEGGVPPPPGWAEDYEAVLSSGDPAGAPQRARAGDPLTLLYTSGTTGRPKGVVCDNRASADLAEIISSELALGSDGRLLAMAPVFHAGARSLYSAQLWRGGTVVLHRGFDADRVLETVERERITAMHLVPTMVQSLLNAPAFANHDLSSLRMVMYAAAPMPVPLLRRAFEAFGPILYNGYGQTEINMLTLLHPHQHVLDGPPERTARLASVGQPHPRSEIRIVAEDGTECPPGMVGEIAGRSSTAMTGYWNRSIDTMETLRDGWVMTGDMGRLDGEGFLFLVDRKKDMIISGGENIYSREVEEAVASHPAVADVAVIGVPDERWGEAVRAVVVPRAGRDLSADVLIAHCKTRIASFKCPKAVVFVEELPRLATGKIDKNALRRAADPIQSQPPQSPQPEEQAR